MPRSQGGRRLQSMKPQVVISFLEQSPSLYSNLAKRGRRLPPWDASRMDLMVRSEIRKMCCMCLHSSWLISCSRLDPSTGRHHSSFLEAAPSFSMPSQPVAFPANSSALPYPWEGSRFSPACFMVFWPAALSCSPDDFHACEPLRSPIAAYECQHLIWERTTSETEVRDERELTSAAPLTYCAWPPMRLGSWFWLLSDMLWVVRVQVLFLCDWVTDQSKDRSRIKLSVYMTSAVVVTYEVR